MLKLIKFGVKYIILLLIDYAFITEHLCIDLLILKVNKFTKIIRYPKDLTFNIYGSKDSVIINFKLSKLN